MVFYLNELLQPDPSRYAKGLCSPMLDLQRLFGIQGLDDTVVTNTTIGG